MSAQDTPPREGDTSLGACIERLDEAAKRHPECPLVPDMTAVLFTLSAALQRHMVLRALITSVRWHQAGAHDLVQVWIRGGYAGELVMDLGDGEKFASAVGAPREEEP